MIYILYVIYVYYKCMQKLKEKYSCLVRFLKGQGLRFKCIVIDDNQIEYFRMNELKQLLDGKRKQIEYKKQIHQLIKQIIWDDVLDYYQREEGAPNYKWPDYLVQITLEEQDVQCESQNQFKDKNKEKIQHKESAQQTTSKENSLKKKKQVKFASFKFSTILEGSKFVPFCIAGGILGILLFSLWPYWLKYAVFIVILSSLTIFLAFIGLRIAIYCFGIAFKRSVWLFPNVFEQGSFKQSFYPFIQQRRWQGSLYDLSLQIGAIIMIMYLAWSVIYDVTSLRSSWKAVLALTKDILNWGDSFAKGQINILAKALTSSNL